MSKRQIHPSIDHLFSKDYHFDYRPIGRALTNNKVLLQLHKMANIPGQNALIVSQAENSANAQEIIQCAFVKKALETSQDQNAILITTLKTAMSNVGFTAGKLETERQRHRQRDKATQKHKYRDPDRHKDRKTDTETQRHTETETDRDTDRDRQTETETETETETYIQTEIDN